MRCGYSLVATGLIGLGLVAPALGQWWEYPPPWRGAEGSTYQEWTFDDNDNPAAPEVIDNPYEGQAPPYGGTVAVVLGGDFQPPPWSTAVWAPQVFQRDGVWTEVAVMDLIIDNTPEVMPAKEVWIEVVYWGPSSPPFPSQDHVDISVENGTLLDDQRFPLGGPPGIPEAPQWWLALTKWRLEPSPSYEMVLIGPPSEGATAIIDQVVVDTIVLPEPATGLTAVAGLALALCARPGRVRNGDASSFKCGTGSAERGRI